MSAFDQSSSLEDLSDQDGYQQQVQNQVFDRQNPFLHSQRLQQAYQSIFLHNWTKDQDQYIINIIENRDDINWTKLQSQIGKTFKLKIQRDEVRERFILIAKNYKVTEQQVNEFLIQLVQNGLAHGKHVTAKIPNGPFRNIRFTVYWMKKFINKTITEFQFLVEKINKSILQKIKKLQKSKNKNKENIPVPTLIQYKKLTKQQKRAMCKTLTLGQEKFRHNFIPVRLRFAIYHFGFCKMRKVQIAKTGLQSIAKILNLFCTDFMAQKQRDTTRTEEFYWTPNEYKELRQMYAIFGQSNGIISKQLSKKYGQKQKYGVAVVRAKMIKLQRISLLNFQQQFIKWNKKYQNLKDPFVVQFKYAHAEKLLFDIKKKEQLLKSVELMQYGLKNTNKTYCYEEMKSMYDFVNIHLKEVIKEEKQQSYKYKSLGL